ncbi:MAG: metalloregulator ArsR/SmtB family transcription factor [Acidimicrobiia bacterium]
MTSAAVQPSTLDRAAHAVADPTRRRILHIVRDEEVPAGEVAAHFTHLSRPAVSQHLRVLTDAALVSVRVDGNRRLYRAQPEGLVEVREFVESMWTDRLARLKFAAERAERSEPKGERKVDS